MSRCRVFFTELLPPSSRRHPLRLPVPSPFYLPCLPLASSFLCLQFYLTLSRPFPLPLYFSIRRPSFSRLSSAGMSRGQNRERKRETKWRKSRRRTDVGKTRERERETRGWLNWGGSVTALVCGERALRAYKCADVVRERAGMVRGGQGENSRLATKNHFVLGTEPSPRRLSLLAERGGNLRRRSGEKGVKRGEGGETKRKRPSRIERRAKKNRCRCR